MNKNKEFIFKPDTHKYFYDGIRRRSVTEILRQEGYSNFDFVNPLVMDRTQKFGNAVHRVCELDDLHNLDMSSVSVPLLPYFEGWRKYKADYKVEIIETELRMYSTKWDFCGTLDRVVKENGIITLIDIKSGTSITRAQELQTAFYKVLYEENFPKSKIKDRCVIQLKDDGTYNRIAHNNKRDEQIAISLAVVNQDKAQYKLIKG